ncbi:Superoxide dismutase [Cu-Zn] precursor [Cronobacter muytjensii 530]
MKRLTLAALVLLACGAAQAASEEVELRLATDQGVGQSVGTVKITETDKGLEFAPDLNGLPPGDHGFHIHANGSCEPAMKDGKMVAAEAAGGHFGALTGVLN